MRTTLKDKERFRRSYIKTLGDLFTYSTEVYADRVVNFQAGKDKKYTYSEFATQTKEFSHKLRQYGIGEGDRVAILSQSHPFWACAFFAATAFGRVAVPILIDFSQSEITNVLTHSESKALFVSKTLLKKVSQECLDRLTLVIDIETGETIKEDKKEFTCMGKVSAPVPDDLAAIIYTSGTTGKAKGVMLSHRNFIVNVFSSYEFFNIGKKDVMMSILPLAHTYELSLGLLYPFYAGAAVCYLSKPPVPSYLMKIMQEVKPTAMLSVPLIIEKVYKSSIVPTIKSSRFLTWMDQHMHTTMCKIIGKKMIQTFGGRLRFFGIGGAKLDPDIEKFLFEARFPYYIGYGLTECAPLLAYCTYKNTSPGNIGKASYGVTLKLDNMNEQGVGEIVAKGDNIMMGYYKDPERTREAFNEEGWFKTNDLAAADQKGRYAIRGRLNNMILGASGENIYPEEIEKVVNDIDVVNESLVLERRGRLVALVSLNDNVINWDHESEEEILKKVDAIAGRILSHVNKNVAKNSSISSVEVQKEPFEKTATKKIRRFKYK